MPHDTVLLEQIVEQAAHTQALQVLDIHAHRFGAMPAVTSRHFWRDGLIAGNNPVDELSSRVFVNDAHVVGERKSFGLSRLGHQIRNENSRCGRFFDRLGDAGYQKVRQDAGV